MLGFFLIQKKNINIIQPGLYLSLGQRKYKTEILIFFMEEGVHESESI